MKNKQTDRAIQNPCCSFVGGHRADCPNYKEPDRAKECKCICHHSDLQVGSDGQEYRTSMCSCHSYGGGVITCEHCKPEQLESEVTDWESYVDKWSKQGRSEEQIYAVRNFMTGQGAIMLKDLHKGCISKKELREIMENDLNIDKKSVIQPTIDKSEMSDWEGLRNFLYVILELNSAQTLDVMTYARANFISKKELEEAIGEDEYGFNNPSGMTDSFYQFQEVRNEFRKMLKDKFNL